VKYSIIHTLKKQSLGMAYHFMLSQ